MYRDFVYLDMNRVQSIIAQLEQGLLSQVMEGETEDTKGRAQMVVNLLAMLLPVSVLGSVEHGRGASISESRVLHDYAFEAARQSLEDEGLLSEGVLDRDEVPESGFVLVRGSARISDYRTLEKIAANFDKVDKVLPSKKTDPKKTSKTMKEMATVIDTFYKDAIRVKVTNARGSSFVGPLDREHLREDIRDLIYKYSSAPEGEWIMLAAVSRVPRPEDSGEEAIMARLEEVEGTDSVSSQMGVVMSMLNGFQELFGSVSYPNIAVSPIAVYREIGSGERT